MLIIPTLLALLAAPPQSAPARKAPPAAELEADLALARAKRLRDDGQFREAAAEMDRILTLGVPVPPEFHYHHGVCREKGGQAAGAAASFRQYLEAGGRGGEFYRLALDGVVRCEAAAAAQAKAGAARARAVAELAAAQEELKVLGQRQEAILSELKTRAAEVVGPVFQAMDAVLWPERAYVLSTGKLLNFNRADLNLQYRYSRGEQDGRPVRKLTWGMGTERTLDRFLVLDLPFLDELRVHLPGHAAETNLYQLIVRTWSVAPEGVRIERVAIDRPYAWDRDRGQLEAFRKLEAEAAPFIAKAAALREELEGVLARRRDLVGRWAAMVDRANGIR